MVISTFTDIYMGYIYVISVNKFFNLLRVSESSLFEFLLKFTLFYSILPICTIRTVTNIILFVNYNLIVFGNLDEATCNCWRNDVYGEKLLWMGYTSNFIPSYVAFIILYVIHFFGSNRSCVVSTEYEPNPDSLIDKDEDEARFSMI